MALVANAWGVVLSLVYSGGAPIEFALTAIYLCVPSTLLGALIGATVLSIATFIIVALGIERPDWRMAHAVVAGALCFVGALPIAFAWHRTLGVEYIPLFTGVFGLLGGAAAGDRLSRLSTPV